MDGHNRPKTSFGTGRPSSRRNEQSISDEWGRPVSSNASFVESQQSRPASVIARLQSESRPGASILTKRPSTSARCIAGARPMTGTGRPETAGFNSRIPKNAEINLFQISDRPTTQQGVQGVRITTAGTTLNQRRMIHDKSYFKVVLSEKIMKLTKEIKTLEESKDSMEQEQSSWISVEQKAKDLASEMIKLEAEMNDYNDLNDMVASGNDKWDLIEELKHTQKELQAQSEKVDSIFNSRKNLEQHILNLELGMEHERGRANRIIQELPDDVRDQYESLMEETFYLQTDAGQLQMEYDELNRKTNELYHLVCDSEVKCRAVQLEEEHLKICDDKDEILKNSLSFETSDQEKSRLLTQIKIDDEENLKIGKQVEVYQKKLEDAKIEFLKIEKEIQDMEASQSEYLKENVELKKHENEINEFLSTFKEKQDLALQKIQSAENSNSVLNSKISKYNELTNSLTGNEPPEKLKILRTEISSMQETNDNRDADAKESLEEEATRLEDTLESMHEDLERFRNVDKLQYERNEEITQLQKTYKSLDDKLKIVIALFQSTKKETNKLESELNQNEVHKQLKELELKWTKLEEYNYKLLESIQAGTKEDYSHCQKLAQEILEAINQALQDKYDIQ